MEKKTVKIVSYLSKPRNNDKVWWGSVVTIKGKTVSWSPLMWFYNFRKLSKS